LNPGIDDDAVLGHSHQRTAVPLTSDKDFGDLVFRRRLLHSGVVLLRLEGLRPERKATVVAAMLDSHGAELAGKFAVLTEKTLRVRRPARGESDLLERRTLEIRTSTRIWTTRHMDHFRVAGYPIATRGQRCEALRCPS
jgi:predicted nuclease of predicted toxin-antitoxin system